LNIKIKGGSSVSKDVLGYQLPKQIEEIRKRIAFSLNEKQFLKLFELFFKVELQMKLSKDRETLLFALFLELNQILRQ
jgi:DNA polymerase III delta subunit